jgi:adenosylcobinamide-GDP ribazoletransferase
MPDIPSVNADPFWRRELRLFYTALQFFTRVPVPAWVGWSPGQLNASARHFPTVGLLVGAISGGVLIGAALIWPPQVAAWLAIAAGIWLTGAFHEDGLADSCDGFGGGDQPAQVLAIMKDSRVGSYATVAMVLALGLKAQLLGTLWQGAPSAGWVLAALMASHAMSRWAALAVMARLDYVREDAQSKSKPIAQGIAAGPLAFASLVALLPGAVLGVWVLPGAAAAVGVWWLAVRYLRRRLGGYVGDALGATQQLAELAILLAMTAGLPWLWSWPAWP